MHAFDPSTREAEASLVYRASFKAAKAVVQRNSVLKYKNKNNFLLKKKKLDVILDRGLGVKSTCSCRGHMVAHNHL